jgi:hypothetical protein
MGELPAKLKVSAMNDNNPPNSQDGSIDPGHFRSWLHIVHSDRDKGLRDNNWWWHNKNFSISTDANNVSIDFEVANRGWADAKFVMVDYFVPTIVGIQHIRDESLSLMSGELRPVHFKFTIDGDLPIDSIPASANGPSVIIRITDLTSAAPSPREIIACMKELDTDRITATKTFFSWKKIPGMFVYPCCAPFPGQPDQ